jgi:hypothetical protein
MRVNDIGLSVFIERSGSAPDRRREQSITGVDAHHEVPTRARQTFV